jgi:hypothetical protein
MDEADFTAFRARAGMNRRGMAPSLDSGAGGSNSQEPITIALDQQSLRFPALPEWRVVDRCHPSS